MRSSLLVAAVILLAALADARTVTGEDKQKASDANQKGIKVATSGDLAQSVDLFKKAIKLDRYNSEYPNNLGVTYMRLGRLDEAEDFFKKALKLNANNPEAKANLQDLAQYRQRTGGAAAASTKSPAYDDEEDEEDEEEEAAYDDDDEEEEDEEEDDDEQSDDEDEEDDDEEEEEEEEYVPPRRKRQQQQQRKQQQKPQAKKGKDSGSKGSNKKAAAASTSGAVAKKRPPVDRTLVTNTRRHPRRQLPRIHIRDFYKPENKVYHEGRLPFLLEGALENWTALHKWNDDYLIKKFPEAVVDFYPHNMAKVDTHPFLTKLPIAISELWNPTGQFPRNEDYPGTYMQWNIGEEEWKQLREDMDDLPFPFKRDEDWLGECLSSDAVRHDFTKRTHWRMLLIGNKGAGMFGHQDVLLTSSWQAQLKGVKRWFICAPDQKPYLYSAGVVDAWDWDHVKHPLFEKADCYEAHIKAGEMLFYPSNYWHQTTNMETPTWSISANVCDEQNFALISQELRNECGWQKFKWGFSKELCGELENCMSLWKGRWAPERDTVPTCESDKKAAA